MLETREKFDVLLFTSYPPSADMNIACACGYFVLIILLGILLVTQALRRRASGPLGVNVHGTIF